MAVQPPPSPFFHNGRKSPCIPPSTPSSRLPIHQMTAPTNCGLPPSPSFPLPPVLLKSLGQSTVYRAAFMGSTSSKMASLGIKLPPPNVLFIPAGAIRLGVINREIGGNITLYTLASVYNGAGWPVCVCVCLPSPSPTVLSQPPKQGAQLHTWLIHGTSLTNWPLAQANGTHTYKYICI